MSFRIFAVYVFALSCDPGVIDRSSASSDPNAGATTIELGDYELQRPTEDPQGVPGNGFADVVFIAKTAAGMSLIFAKGKTWKYNEETDEVQEIMQSVDSAAWLLEEELAPSGGEEENSYYRVSTTIFWGLTKGEEDDAWKLTKYVDEVDEDGKVKVEQPRYSIGGGYYEEKMPRILYLDEEKALIYSKKKLFLFSNELKQGSGSRGIVLSRSDGKDKDIISGAENYLVGGICDDGKSVWIKSQRQARVIRYEGYLTVKDEDDNIVYEKDEKGEEQKDENGEKIEKKEHKFFSPTEVDMKVNGNTGKPIFSMWISINEDKITQEGTLVGIDESGNLLIATEKEIEEDEE